MSKASVFWNSETKLKLNPPKAKSARNMADSSFIRLRLINSLPLGAIMDIPIDTPLLCGEAVHF